MRRVAPGAAVVLITLCACTTTEHTREGFGEDSVTYACAAPEVAMTEGTDVEIRFRQEKNGMRYAFHKRCRSHATLTGAAIDNAVQEPAYTIGVPLMLPFTATYDALFAWTQEEPAEQWCFDHRREPVGAGREIVAVRQGRFNGRIQVRASAGDTLLGERAGRLRFEGPLRLPLVRRPEAGRIEIHGRLDTERLDCTVDWEGALPDSP